MAVKVLFYHHPLMISRSISFRTSTPLILHFTPSFFLPWSLVHASKLQKKQKKTLFHCVLILSQQIKTMDHPLFFSCSLTLSIMLPPSLKMVREGAIFYYLNTACSFELPQNNHFQD